MLNNKKTNINYNFDKVINRENTASVKYDLRNNIFKQDDVLPMWVADMDFETPDFIKNALKKRVEHSIYGYSFRPDSYYRSITSWVQQRHNWEIKNDWIVFSPGVVPALNFSTLAFTSVGDGVIVQPPVYFPFFSAITLNNRKRLNNNLIIDKDRYYINFEDFEKKAKSASMFFISNPHNPVGRVWTAEELTKIGEICLRNNVIIVSDEIHNDLILPGNNHTCIASISQEIADITITCIAPSKTFNIAGLATSSIIISNQKLRNKFKKIVDGFHLSNGNLFGAVASEAGYKYGSQWVDELMKYVAGNFAEVKQALQNANSDVKLIAAEATYLAWLDFRDTGFNDKKIKDKLIKKAKLGLSPGPVFGPGGKGFQRLNLAAPRSVVVEAMARLTATFQ